MANTPANAGSSEGQVSRGDTGPRRAAGHRAARPRGTLRPQAPAAPRAAQTAQTPQTAQTAQTPQAARKAQAKAAPAESGGLAWLPYLIALAGVAAGVFLVFQGSQNAGRGTGLIGCSLLAAGLARLVLPPRLAGLLSTRRKASDVLAFTVFGAGVLAVAILLP
jgi:Protein of unknown function (DUF3017)